jgi:hypothetical protein
MWRYYHSAAFPDAQRLAYPCWEKALPEVIYPICVEVLGPVPRRASSVHLPVSSRRTSASPSVQQVRRAETVVIIATSMTNQFRGCSHSVMFRLPHWLDPQIAPTAEAQRLLGSPGRVRHAMPMWLPITDYGIATCLNRAIDTTGLSPARLGPFRPLHARACSAKFLIHDSRPDPMPLFTCCGSQVLNARLGTISTPGSCRNAAISG